MSESIILVWHLLSGYEESLIIQLALAALIIILALLLRKLLTRLIFGLVINITHKTRTDVDRATVMAFEGPLRSLIVVTGFYLALNILALPVALMIVISNLFRSVIIILITWGIYNLVGGSVVSELSDRLKIDHSITEFAAKVLRFVIIALSITIIAQEWNYNVSGFVAGLGLGGLAFALAAKDAASNVFGGIVIILDKPFTVGDWILTPSVEGTVEEIAFRSTRVRTFANALVTVPNAVLANEAVTNWSRMEKRRVTFNLGVTYTTPRAKLQKCIQEIKTYLQNHPEVHPDLIFVRFDHFNDSSLDIFIYFFTKTRVWGEFLAVKEEINFKIMEILENEGVSVAFPSRSLYFENKLKSDQGAPPDEQ